MLVDDDDDEDDDDDDDMADEVEYAGVSGAVARLDVGDWSPLLLAPSTDVRACWLPTSMSVRSFLRSFSCSLSAAIICGGISFIQRQCEKSTLLLRFRLARSDSADDELGSAAVAGAGTRSWLNS